MDKVDAVSYPKSKLWIRQPKIIDAKERQEIEALKASLSRAYELVYDYWNLHASSDYNGDAAKELRRSVWDKCLKPHNIPHPKEWAG